MEIIISNWRTQIALLGVVSFFTLILLTGSAQAAADTCVWIGSAADGIYETPSNWSGCDGTGIPEADDIIEFDTESPVLTEDSIITIAVSGASVAGINVTGASTDYYNHVLTGGDLSVGGDFTGDATGSNGVVIKSNLTLTADANYSSSKYSIDIGWYDTESDFNLGGFAFVNTTPHETCRGIRIYSRLTGTGVVSSTSGSSGLVFKTGGSDFSGTVTSNGSGVSIEAAGAVGSAPVTINEEGIIGFSSYVENYDVDVVINSANNGANLASFGQFKCSGGGEPLPKITNAGDLTITQALVFDGYSDMEFTGAFTSNDNTVTVLDGAAGTITTSEGTSETQPSQETIGEADKDPDAYVSVGNKQTITVNGERGGVTVNANGILKGTGTIGALYVLDGGTLAPGQSPGCLSSGNLDLADGSTFEVEIDGATPCTEHDQQSVTGTVNIESGAILQLVIDSGYDPEADATFIIIDNDGSDAVTGTFSGLDEGATVTINDVVYTISYEGGDGNDVVLTATTVPEAPDTGFIQFDTANPAMIAAGAITASLAMIVIGRQYSKD